tara:strand:- start:281 stop:871 length:591 start_codon:yes stop_codon:yes gene_type:complete
MVALFNRTTPLTSELEALAGKAMLAHARREGHMALLPAAMDNPFAIRDERKRLYLADLQANPGSTAKESAMRMGLRLDKIRDATGPLLAAGHIKSRYVGNTPRYTATPSGLALIGKPERKGGREQNPKYAKIRRVALDILRDREAPLAEIAAASGYDRKTASDAFRTLRKRGWVDIDQQGGCYRLTEAGREAGLAA